MIKKHFHDLFTEGLGYVFYMKYYNFINTHIKNEVIKEILIIIHTFVYLAFVFAVVYVIFKLSFPI